MFAGLLRGIVSLGEGLVSIMGAGQSAARFEDYKHLVPGHRDIQILSAEEAMSADAEALRTDWRAMGRWQDIGQSNVRPGDAHAR